MSRTDRYQLRLLPKPVPAVATIDGREHDVMVTAWQKRVTGWSAWCRLPDAPEVVLVHAEDIRRREDSL